MQIIQIMQGENNGFVSVVPQNVQAFPVNSVEEAQQKLVELMGKNFKEYDITVKPVVDDDSYRSIDEDGETVDTDVESHYCISTVKGPSATEVVAELFIEESAVSIAWFLVD